MPIPISYANFVQEFKSQVQSLSYPKGLHLTVTTCRLLFSDYERFSRKHKWGHPALLEKAITLIRLARPGAIDVQWIDGLKSEILQVTPDTGQFGDADGLCALNAAVCVCHSLEYLTDADPKSLLVIGTCYTDTIDVRLHEQGLTTEAAIDFHPLMQEARSLLLQLSR